MKNINSLTNNRCYRNVLITSDFIYTFIISAAFNGNRNWVILSFVQYEFIIIIIIITIIIIIILHFVSVSICKYFHIKHVHLKQLFREHLYNAKMRIRYAKTSHVMIKIMACAWCRNQITLPFLICYLQSLVKSELGHHFYPTFSSHVTNQTFWSTWETNTPLAVRRKRMGIILKNFE